MADELEEYRLSYSGQQVDEAIGKALTGLPTITIAVSQVISQSPLQIQLTNEQYATMNGRSVIFDGSALGMPVVVANFNGKYIGDNNNHYLNFVFIYAEGSESFTDFNRISIHTSTKVAELSFGSVAVPNAETASNADNASMANAVNYLAFAPSSANNTGTLQIVVLSSEPATRYDGYLYIITGSNS